MANIWLTTSTSNRANASNDNGGGYNDANYVGTYAQTYGLNGGPVAAEVSCAISDNGGSVQLTVVTSGFADVLVGQIGKCTFSATYSNGWYEVTNVIDNNNIVIDLAYSSSAPTCDINVGGFFAAPTFADATGLVSAGDEQWIETGDYTLSGNWTMTAGSAGSPVIYKTVDSDGDAVEVTRELQGGRDTGWLDDTDMAKVDLGTNYVAPNGDFITMSNMKFTSSLNENVIKDGDDWITLYKCIVENESTTGVVAGCLRCDDECVLIDSDFISNSTQLAKASFGDVIDVDINALVKNCRIKMASTSGVLANVWYSSSVINNVFIGPSGGTGILATLADTSYSVHNNTFYELEDFIDIDEVGAANSGTISVTDNLAFNASAGTSTFLKNSDTVDVQCVGSHNCLVNINTDYESDAIGLIRISDTTSTQTKSQVFEDADNGDFRLKSGSDAIGAAMFDGDCGAITDVATGGGAIVNQGLHAIESGIMA